MRSEAIARLTLTPTLSIKGKGGRIPPPSMGEGEDGAPYPNGPWKTWSA